MVNENGAKEGITVSSTDKMISRLRAIGDEVSHAALASENIADSEREAMNTIIGHVVEVLDSLVHYRNLFVLKMVGPDCKELVELMQLGEAIHQQFETA
jgi:hypothetical protein